MKHAMRFLTILLISFLSIWSTQAQKIEGKIQNEKKEPVANATVTLLKQKDTSLLRTAISNAEGAFSFNYNDSNKVMVKITVTGYHEKMLAVNNGSLPVITLSRKDAQLNEVVVTAKKPIIEVRPDKTVFNVEASINATGSNALELLQKSPGVIVDKDDNIVLSGKNGVRIYIDGKPSPLSMKDVTAQLKGMNSSDIEAIEIITNPSARYDAEGNAGIINIRLKKNKNYGWNGNLAGGYGVAVNSRYNESGSLNFRNKNINFFSNVSAFQNKNENIFRLYRVQNDTTYDQESVGIYRSKGYNLKTGMDWFISKKQTLGIVVTGNINDVKGQNNSQTDIADEDLKTVDRILFANGTNQSKRNNLSTNLNYRFTDSTGKEFSMDADYGIYRVKSQTYIPNIYTDPSGSNVISEYTFGTDAPTNINLYSFKADYEQNLGKGKISGGVKTSLVKTDNDFSFYNYIDNKPEYDVLRSNRFVYTEWVNAAYAQYRAQIKKVSYQLGLRVEHTSSEGDLTTSSTASDKNVKRDYLDFFPSAGISFQLNKKNSLGLSYSRRIDRPRYQDLNPFENKLDELTYQKGNPFLRPQYTNSIELRHTYAFKLTTTLSFSDVQDYFAQITDTVESKRSYIMQRNLANQKIISLNVSYPFNITKWWSVYANVNVYHTRYRATFEEGKGIKLDATVASIYQQQTFKLGKGWSGEISGFFNTPSVWGGTYKTSTIWSLDAGIQKKFWNDNASIKASVTDIFYTMPWSGVSQFGGLYIKASGQSETRQFKVNFSYRFGNKQVKESKKRNTGLDDLNNRAS